MSAGQATARAPRAETEPIKFHIEVDLNNNVSVGASGVDSFVIGDHVQFTSNKNSAIMFETHSPFADADLAPGKPFDIGRRSRVLVVTNAEGICTFKCGHMAGGRFEEWELGKGCHTPKGNCP